MIGKILRGGVAVAMLSPLIGGLAAPAAHADWHERRVYREHTVHEHIVRERVVRQRHYGYAYHYGRRIYVAPPVVYTPPPPPPGISLFFDIR
jgi:hypothetical protein